MSARFFTTPPRPPVTGVVQSLTERPNIDSSPHPSTKSRRGVAGRNRKRRSPCRNPEDNWYSPTKSVSSTAVTKRRRLGQPNRWNDALRLTGDLMAADWPDWVGANRWLHRETLHNAVHQLGITGCCPWVSSSPTGSCLLSLPLPGLCKTPSPSPRRPDIRQPIS